MLGSFLIFAREGLEGTLICAVLFVFLSAAGRRHLFRWVLAGALAAVAIAATAGVALWIATREAFVGSEAQTWFETAVFAVAVAILTYMTFWMRAHARTMVGQLRSRAAGAVDAGSGPALAAVAFVTVGREAVETVIFLLAVSYAASAYQLWIGAGLGLVVALSVGVAMYRLGKRVDLGRFFTIVGSLLMVVAAGLLADAIQNLQSLGALPGQALRVWDLRGVLPDDSGLGDALHGLVGYSSAPSVLQVAVWAGFLVIALAAFLRPARRTPPRPTASATA